MDQPDYRVLLEGRMVGPYSRTTILGMRIKQMLSGDDVVVSSDGTRLTVRELARQDRAGRAGAPSDVEAASPGAGRVESPGSVIPMPQQAPTTRQVRGGTPPAASSTQVLAIAVTGIALVIGVMLLVLLLRRVY